MGKIHVSVGITKNLGNFESLRLEASKEEDEAVLGEDPWGQLWKEVQDQVEKQLLEVAETIG